MAQPNDSTTPPHSANALLEEVMREDGTYVEPGARPVDQPATEEDEDADPVGDGTADFQVVRRATPLRDTATQPVREPSHLPISEPVGEPVTEPQADPINEPGNDAPNLTDEDAIPSDGGDDDGTDDHVDSIDDLPSHRSPARHSNVQRIG